MINVQDLIGVILTFGIHRSFGNEGLDTLFSAFENGKT